MYLEHGEVLILNFLFLYHDLEESEIEICCVKFILKN
jgi:hypothetical protein